MTRGGVLSTLFPGRSTQVFERWTCQSPECKQRHRLHAWYRRPYSIELQGGRCCSPQCLQSAITRMVGDWLPIEAPPEPRPHRIPLGLLLLSRNLITADQLRQAVQAQQQNGYGRLGEWLCERRMVAEGQITAAVALQWARPIFPLSQSHSWQQCRGWLPMTLIENCRMAPLHFAADRQTLFVGFTQDIDFQVLEAIQSVYGCRTEPCIVSDSSLNAVVAEFRLRSVHRSAVDLLFEETDVEEIGSIVRQYAQRLTSRQIRLSVVPPFLWVRLQGEFTSHLTFRNPRRGPAATGADTAVLTA